MDLNDDVVSGWLNGSDDVDGAPTLRVRCSSMALRLPSPHSPRPPTP